MYIIDALHKIKRSTLILPNVFDCLYEIFGVRHRWVASFHWTHHFWGLPLQREITCIMNDPFFSITCHFILTFLFHLTVKVRITLGSNWHVYNCRNPHLFLQRLRDMETIFTKICQCLHVSYTHSKQSEACILILMLVYRLWYRLNVCIKTLSISNSIVSVRFKTTQWNLSYDFLWILPA